MILAVLLPILVLFVVLTATTGLALRSRRSSRVVDREFFPAAASWIEPRPLAEPEPETLFQNPQGNDLTLNDLMFYKLKLHYPAIDGLLDDYLEQFRKDHP